MSKLQLSMQSRRAFLASSSAMFAVGTGLFSLKRPLKAATDFQLRATNGGQIRIAPEPYKKTQVWSYNGLVPGPEIRVRQGEKLRITVENGLNEETTTHWHGIRTPNAMDGVPHLTQTPISPGKSFNYEFDAVDAGTFWYHPHQRSTEQVGRGLYGPLIVEEHDPVRVDRELTWILDDWRLTKSAQISDDFSNRHDMSHNGRVGNTVTINGRIPDVLTVRKGERIRLRLINAANARIFGLEFHDHEPIVIALDGQPVTPHTPNNNLIILGPAMRADLVIDMVGKTGSRIRITDQFYQGLEYNLIDIVYTDTALRNQSPDWPVELPANPLSEPNLDDAIQHEIEFTGGMMGGMIMQEMRRETDEKISQSLPGGMGSMMGMMHADKMWFINGIAAEGHVMDPILKLKRGQSYGIAMTNMTAWHHPIHLHGHSFRVLKRNNVPTLYREWQDTVLMAPREKVEIAFVADNPGDWMFHCHILEHMVAGMMGVIRVS